MKGIACTIERIERRVSINIVDRVGSLETEGEGGGCGSLRWR